MTVIDFAFADHAEHFDQHITDSIPRLPPAPGDGARASPGGSSRRAPP